MMDDDQIDQSKTNEEEEEDVGYGPKSIDMQEEPEVKMAPILLEVNTTPPSLGNGRKTVTLQSKSPPKVSTPPKSMSSPSKPTMNGNGNNNVVPVPVPAPAAPPVPPKLPQMSSILASPQKSANSNKNHRLMGSNSAPLRSPRAGVASYLSATHSVSSSTRRSSLQNHRNSRSSGGGGPVGQDLANALNEYYNRPGIPMYEIFKATRRIKSQHKCWEGVLFLLFIILFALVVIQMRKTNLAGETTEALLDLFMQEEFSAVNDVSPLDQETPFFKKTYGDIMTPEEWWLWLLGPLTKGLFEGGTEFGTSAYGLPHGVGQIYVMGGSQGGIIIRTARVKPEGDLQPLFGKNRAVFPRWDEHEEAKEFVACTNLTIDDGNYGDEENLCADSESIICPNMTLGKVRNGPSCPGFVYNTSGLASDLIGTFLGGGSLWQRNNYGSHGFFIDLPNNNFDNLTADTFAELYENDWIDVATRVVSVEFNTYNPTTRIVTAVRFFTEFSQTGNVRPSYRMYHLNAAMWASLGPGYIACACVFLLLLLWFTLRWFNRFIKSSNIFLTVTRWKVVFEGLLIILFWVYIGFTLSLTATSQVIRKSRLDETLQQEYFATGIYDDALLFHHIDTLAAINLVLATVQLISFLPFKTTATIWATLGGAVKDIIVLGLVIGFFWVGFGFGSHITFGSLGFKEFDRFDRTMGTLMVLMFSGDIDFDAMREVSFTAAPVFYSLYMIFMWGVMLNLFVAIIVLTYERFSNVRLNYDNWAKEHHGTEHGCIVMTKPEKFLRYMHQKYYKFRLWQKAGRTNAVPGGSQSTSNHTESYHHSMRRALFFGRRRSSGAGYGSSHDEDVQVGVEMTSTMGSESPHADSSASLGEERFFYGVLRSEIDEVLQAGPPGSEARQRAAMERNYPLKRLFVEMVNLVLDSEVKPYRWFCEVQETKKALEKYESSLNESSLIRIWRSEFTYSQGTNVYSLADLFSCCCCCFRRGSRKSKNNASLERQFSARAQHSSSIYGNDRDPTVREIVVLEQVIKRDQELLDAKLEIEFILQKTRALFKNHRLSFNRLLRNVWNKSTDEERLQELHLEELVEILSPGCIEEGLKDCRHCKDGKTILKRAQTLLDKYTILKKRKVLKPKIRRGHNRSSMLMQQLAAQGQQQQQTQNESVSSVSISTSIPSIATASV